MIDMTRKYRTRDGRDVRIYARDGGGDRSIHGASRTTAGEWIAYVWTSEGNYFSDCDSRHDLIEVRENHKQTVWVTLDKSGEPNAWRTKEAALACGNVVYKACIQVELTYEEGEGL